MKLKFERYKPKLELLTTVFSYVGHGVGMYSVISPDAPHPIGFVWVVFTSNSYGDRITDIVDLYVPETFRRCGVARWMLNMLTEQYGTLRTGKGTKTGGMALMKSMGWKKDRATGDWYLNLAKH